MFVAGHEKRGKHNGWRRVPFIGRPQINLVL